MFLKRVHELPRSASTASTTTCSASLGVPYEEVQWRRDVSPINREDAAPAASRCRWPRSSACTGSGATSSPTSTRWRGKSRRCTTSSTRPRTGSPSGTSTASSSPAAWPAPSAMKPRRPPPRAARRLLPHHRHRVHAHPGHRGAALDPGAGRGREAVRSRRRGPALPAQPAERRRGVREVPRHQVRRHEALRARRAPKAVIPILDTMLGAAADDGLDGAVLGMAHRGRLNVLANIVGKSYDQIFREFEGYVDPNSVQGSGDVKYHLGAVGKYVSRAGADIKVELAANPATSRPSTRSCSAWCGPGRTVIDQPEHVLGAAGADPRRRRLRRPGRGGRVPQHERHQRATASAARSTSSSTTRSASPPRPSTPARRIYATDVAKMIQAPIFHVNGDDPEACVRVARLAYDYRQRFHKDVVIDMVCYRRHGHNEGDDPSYTQPLMYRAIDSRRSVRKLFTEALVRRGDITLDEAEAALDDFQHRLQQALDETRSTAPPRRCRRPGRRRPSACCPTSRPASTRATLDAVFEHFTDVPGGLHAPSEAGPPVRRPLEAVPRAGRGGVGHGRAAGLRHRSCSRAPPSAWPARTAAGARSASATPASSTTRRARRGCRSPPCPARRPSSGCTTRCCRSTPPSASSTATRSPTRTRSCCGRRSSATS